MLKSFALLFVSNQFFPDDKQYRISKFLLDELHSINCIVEKIVFVHEDENTVTYELNNLYKEYDFVIVLDAGLKSKVTFQALWNICNEELGNQLTNNLTNLTNNINNHNEEQYNNQCPSSTRYLKLNDGNAIADIIFYLGTIYVLKCESVENIFTQLLKNHLQQYQNIVTFRKKIHIICQGKNSQENVKIFEDLRKKENEEIKIQLEKTDFNLIVEDVIALRQQFVGSKLIVDCDIDLMMEKVFNSMEEHIQTALKVSPVVMSLII